MERLKSFVVVCISILIGTGAGAQISGVQAVAAGMSGTLRSIPAAGAGGEVGMGVLVAGSGSGVSGFREVSGVSGMSGVSGVSGAGPFGMRGWKREAGGGLDDAWMSLTPTLTASYWPADPVQITRVSPAAARPRFSVNQAVESDYYTRHLGFMCKRELQFEKTTHIPLRFRLGSLEQCNFLEGK